MDNNDGNKNTGLRFKSVEKNFDPYENVEIAGLPEHNARVRERRNQQLFQTENALTRQELQAIKDNLQKQIDEAKQETKSTKKTAFWSSFRSWASLLITAISLIVSIIALG